MSASKTAPASKAFVVGVGMTKFCKPQKTFDAAAPDYPDFVKVAVTRALEDAQLSYSDVECAAVGSLSSPKGQRSLYEMGLTGIPIFNVANACATGSNALYLARSFVESGQHDCCLAVGVEIMAPGSLGGGGTKGAGMLDMHLPAMVSKYPLVKAPPMPQMFGNAGREHKEMYGSTNEVRHSS
jgi:acetyl-CoA acetyltransferase